MKKYILSVILVLALALSMAACNDAGNTTETGASTTPDGTVIGGTSGNETPNQNPSGTTPDNTVTAGPGETSATPGDIATTIVLTFNGTQLNTSVADAGITVEGNAFVITRPGTYELKGDLSNGQVRVAVDKTADVELILNNFTASCNNTAPLYIASANKAVIVLAAGSVNSLTDAALYQFPTGEDKPNACLYSSDDLTIKGDGTLTVNANYNNGIGCKNDLRIKSGTITVSAPNNVIKGNDSVEIEAATLTLKDGEDAIKSDNVDRTDKGYILITADAKIDILCKDDALQAANAITVEAGASITGQCGGDALNCPGTINADASAMKIQSATQP